MEDQDRYLRVEFTDWMNNVDDAEFYFTENDTTVQFKVMRRVGENAVLMANTKEVAKRMERIRTGLHWSKVPVLRNRIRKLGVVESPWDTFGPTTPSYMDLDTMGIKSVPPLSRK